MWSAGELYIGEERDFIKKQLRCITIPVLLPTNPVQSSLYLTIPWNTVRYSSESSAISAFFHSLWHFELKCISWVTNQVCKSPKVSLPPMRAALGGSFALSFTQYIINIFITDSLIGKMWSIFLVSRTISDRKPRELFTRLYIIDSCLTQHS